MPRFFVDLPLSPGAKIELPPVPAHHAARVLRLVKGAEVVLFNGRGGEYPAVLEWVDRDGVTALCREWHDVERESPLDIRLAQGISSGERMDYTLQKAVELGVTAIQPLAMRRSVVKLSGERAQRRVEHWQGIVMSACEQSGRNRLPAVAMPLDVPQWLASRPAGLKLFLSPLAQSSLRDLPPPAGPVWLAAGPEGGFEPEEAALVTDFGFTPVRLGPRVLRTETAALAAVAAMQALWGDYAK
ncbi:16S rRNA (uracil(1498)-N(3))-methyltransferase [Betaproteobacteria bacterium SCN2]|jgi:16S rRNA (uracil1498-N3)-methyltransferase|nr:16S rRNA (uracil(1498)-N(3))-methyltransferase [Betaproteobacteria bacterium SCN2]